MSISRIEIVNFRSFASVDIDNLPSSAVVIGENGAGKTNLVRALQLVLDDSISSRERRLGEDDFWDGLDRAFAGATIEVAIELSGYADDEDAMAVLTDCTVSLEPPTGRLTYRYRPNATIEENNVDGRSEADYEFVIFGGVDESNLVSSEMRRYVGLKLFPALRDAETEIQTWRRSSPLREVLEGLRRDKDFSDEIVDAVSEANELLLEHEQVADLALDLNELLVNVAGELFAVDTEMGIAALRREQVLRAVRLFVSNTAGQQRGLGDAGLGTANIMFLILLLKSLAQRKVLGELVTTILAVEEPEAHLHPHLQRVLFAYLLRTESALLVTTHSPHVRSQVQVAAGTPTVAAPLR